MGGTRLTATWPACRNDPLSPETIMPNLRGDARPVAPAGRKTKPRERQFEPSTEAERKEAAARVEHNRAIALRFAGAGVPVLATRGKYPLAADFPRRAETLTPDDKAEIIEHWRSQAPGRERRKPYAIGSTADRMAIEAITAFRGELAFGVSPGLAGVVCVDCDDESGVTALAYLAEHGEAVDFSGTPVTVSGSRGGRHFWFACAEGMNNSKLASLSADVKATGGMVVLPGMILPPKVDADGNALGSARHYRPLPGTPDLAKAIRAGSLPPFPACLRALIVATNDKRSADADPFIAAALDALAAGPMADKPERDPVAMAEALAEANPKFGELWREGHEKGDRSAGRFNVGKHLLQEYGVNGFDVHDFAELLDSWPHAGEFDDRDMARAYGKHAKAYGARATGDTFGVADDVPPLDHDRTRQALASLELATIMGTTADRPRAALVLALRDNEAHRIAKAVQCVDLTDDDSLSAIKALVAQSTGDEPPEPTAPAPVGRPKRRPRYDAEIGVSPLPVVEQLVRGLLTAGEIVVAAGAPGAGKSVDLLHLGLCVAEGRPYHGRPVKQAGVMIVGSENPEEDERRHVANRKHYDRARGLPLLSDPTCPSLFREDGKPTKDEARLIRQALAMKADTGHACRLIIVDNVRRIIAPGSTSDEAHVTGLMKSLERIREATGATVLVIHHTIRDGSRFAGSGAIESHVDSLWHFEAADPKAKRSKPARIRFDKLRLGDRTQILEYRFATETVAEDADGEPIRTVVSVDHVPIAQAVAGQGTDGAAFGAADEADTAADLGEPVDARPEPSDGRLDLILEVVAGLGAGGRGAKATDIVDTFNAKRRAQGRKTDQLRRRMILEAVADLIEANKLRRQGAGPAAVYRLCPAS